MFLREERGREGERRDEESHIQYRRESVDLFSLQGGDALHMFTQTFTSHLEVEGGEEVGG